MYQQLSRNKDVGQLETGRGEVVAIDGSFFRGNASKGSIITRNRLTQQLKKLELSIEQYHQALNEQDLPEATYPAGQAPGHAITVSALPAPSSGLMPI